MSSVRQKWAINRNWLIMRLRGAHSIFTHSTQELLHELIPQEDWQVINNVNIGIGKLIDKVSESKYMEDKHGSRHSS